MVGSVKQKIRWGTLFLFFLVLISGGVGIFYLVRIKNDTKEILKDNYESIDYGHRMLGILDSLPFAPSTYLQRFDRTLQLQEQNITEAGERDATRQIRASFQQLNDRKDSSLAILQIRSSIQQILVLNMSAIEQKNRIATQTADKALTYISIIAAIIFIVGLTFVFNFPSIVIAPIDSLIVAIQEIGLKNYSYRIHFDRKDEFGQLADSINEMAHRLEYFESSNLNKIIFEKTRAEAVINSLKDASIGLDKNGMILFANDQALQLLGLTAKDIVGKPVEEISKRNDLLRFLLEEKANLPFKIVVDGKENYFTKEIMDVAQDNLNSRVIVLRNITSFKELDVAKTNFIATISHELKTPLASSDFSIKLLEDNRVGQLSSDQQELVQQLKQDNQRMLRILSELLNMAQVEAGKIQLELTDINATTLADNAINATLTTAREKQIIIQKEYDDHTGAVHVDPEKTGWVLNNFIVNAIKHSPENSTIIVKVKRSADQIHFSVKDQGPGISSEYSQKVFERFFKVPGSKPGGTGLGLAISKEFIEAEGGNIWVKTEIGSGSEFGFDLKRRP